MYFPMTGRNPKHDNVPQGYCFPPAPLFWKVRMRPNVTNYVDRFELFLLGEGEKKITETPFPRKSGPYLSNDSQNSDN